MTLELPRNALFPLPPSGLYPFDRHIDTERTREKSKTKRLSTILNSMALPKGPLLISSFPHVISCVLSSCFFFPLDTSSKSVKLSKISNSTAEQSVYCSFQHAHCYLCRRNITAWLMVSCKWRVRWISSEEHVWLIWQKSVNCHNQIVICTHKIYKLVSC